MNGKMEARYIKKGQYVVYGTNGVCHIDDVCEMAFPTGQNKRLYLHLHPIADNASVIYLPFDNEALLYRLRPALTREEAEALLASADMHQAEAWIDDRKCRASAFRQILQDSLPLALLGLIRCICQRRDALESQNKRLANADREVLMSALHAVTEEFSFALSLPRDEVTERVANALSARLP